MKIIKAQKEIDNNVYFFAFINFVVFVIMFYLTKKTPLYSDDLTRALNSDGEPISSFKEMIESTKFYYFNWGGRVISKLLFQYMVVFNRGLYDLLNALFYCVYACLIYLYAFPKKICNSYLIVIYAFLWLFTPSFGGSYLWMTGSITYLWSMVPILLYGLIYYRRWKREGIYSIKMLGFRAFALFFLGIISGWSIEPASCTLLFATTIIVICLSKKSKKIDIDLLMGYLGLVIGFGLLMLSPGNYIRANSVVESNNLLVRYAFRFARESFYMCSYLAIPIGIAVSLYVFANIRNAKIDYITSQRKYFFGYIFQKDNIDSFAFLILAVVSIYVMTFSAAFANRIFITPIALLLIEIGVLMNKLLPNCGEDNLGYKMWKTVLHIFLFFLIIYCLTQVSTAILSCSTRGIPIEKYINYHYPEAENGLID